MPATLYPRINITGMSPGEARTPLRVPTYGGPDDLPISQADAQLAAAATLSVTPGGPTPDAPAERLLAFQVQTKGTVHLRIAFLGDPTTGVVAPAGLSNTKIALVPETEIPPSGHVVNDSLLPTSSDWLAVGDTVTTPSVTGGYAQIQCGALEGTLGNILPLTLTVFESAPTDAINATWFLVIKNTTDPLWLTFAVSEGLNDPASVTELPWIHVPSASASVTLPGPFTPGVPTNPAGTVTGVCNFGPGDLVVSSSSVTESDGNDVVTVEAGTITAGSSGSIVLGYTANDGLSGLTVDIDSTDPTPASELVGDYHNARISVSANALEVGIADTVLVLDASGSMRKRPDGHGQGNESASHPQERRRWDNLVTAADHLVLGYNSFLADEGGASPDSRLGVAVFPDVLGKGTPGWDERAAVLVPSATVSASLPDSVRAKLTSAGDELEGHGMTPMGDAIGVAMGTNTGSTGMFSPTTPAARRRRWMVLMTDGAHNAGTLDPEQFYLPDAVPDFVDKEVRLYAIGYTTASGGTAVDLLRDLAANALNPVDSVGSGDSQFVQAAVDSGAGVGFEKDLTDTFLDAMATSIGLTASADPPGELNHETSTVVHEFHVSAYDTGVAIFVDWHTLDAELVHLTLISPDCEAWPQEQLDKLKQFQFSARPNYSHAYISKDAIASGKSGPRHGTWKLVLELRKRDGHEDVASEPYKYSIFNRSGLRLRACMSGAQATGNPLELVAHLDAHGAPVSGASVVAYVDLPTVDYGSILANAEIDPKLLVRASELAQKEAPEYLGLWALKVQALALDKRTIEVSNTRREIVLHEAAPGEYRGVLAGVAVSGVYQAQIVATGHVGEVPFRRERVVTAGVESVPDPGQTLVTHTLADDSRLIVHVRPRDSFNNAVIFDPSVSPRLGIDVRDAKGVNEVTNQFDGTYTRTFALQGSGRPEVIVTYDGEVIAKPSPLPDPKVLGWMERVVTYDPGDASPGNPKHALGPVEGPNDPFVPVGTCGALELAAARRHFYATHIAVFVHPKSTEPYRVYARIWGERFVMLGVGHGSSQVFEVPRRLGPLRSIIVRPERRKGGPVLIQGIGYALRRRRLKYRKVIRFVAG